MLKYEINVTYAACFALCGIRILLSDSYDK